MHIPRPRPAAILRGHESALTSLHFLPHTSLLASGTSSGTLRLWNTSLHEEVLTLPFPPSPLVAVATDPLSSSLLLHSKTGEVRLVDVAHNPFAPDDAPAARLVREVGSFDDSFAGAKIVGRSVVAGADGARAAGYGVRDLRDGGVWARAEGEVKQTRGMLFCLDGDVGCSHVYAGYEDGSVCAWDLRMEREVAVWEVKVSDDVVTCVRGGAGGIMLAGSAKSGVVAVWDGEKIAGGWEGAVGCVSWAVGGRIALSGGWESGEGVGVWDGRRRKKWLLKKLGRLAWHDGKVGTVEAREDGAVACGGDEGTVALWELGHLFGKKDGA